MGSAVRNRGRRREFADLWIRARSAEPERLGRLCLVGLLPGGVCARTEDCEPESYSARFTTLPKYVRLGCFSSQPRVVKPPPLLLGSAHLVFVQIYLNQCSYYTFYRFTTLYFHRSNCSSSLLPESTGSLLWDRPWTVSHRQDTSLTSPARLILRIRKSDPTARGQPSMQMAPGG